MWLLFILLTLLQPPQRISGGAGRLPGLYCPPLALPKGSSSSSPPQLSPRPRCPCRGSGCRKDARLSEGATADLPWRLLACHHRAGLLVDQLHNTPLPALAPLSLLRQTHVEGRWARGHGEALRALPFSSQQEKMHKSHKGW